MRRDRKIRTWAFLLPLAWLLLLMPPYIRIFDQQATIGGVPLLPAYIFSVWAIGIIGAAIVSRRVLRSESQPDEDEA